MIVSKTSKIKRFPAHVLTNITILLFKPSTQCWMHEMMYVLFWFRLDLVFIRGKRGNKVAVLLTYPIEVCIEELIKTGGVVRVEAPSRRSKGYLWGNDCMSTVVGKCELKRPQAIKSTPVRKYIATVSQVLDMKDNELEWLARHMGHNVRIHKQYYRLQDHILELAKVIKLLLAMENGKAANFMRKKLDDVVLEGQGCYSFLLKGPLGNHLTTNCGRIKCYPITNVIGSYSDYHHILDYSKKCSELMSEIKTCISRVN